MSEGQGRLPLVGGGILACMAGDAGYGPGRTVAIVGALVGLVGITVGVLVFLVWPVIDQATQECPLPTSWTTPVEAELDAMLPGGSSEPYIMQTDCDDPQQAVYVESRGDLDEAAFLAAVSGKALVTGWVYVAGSGTDRFRCFEKTIDDRLTAVWVHSRKGRYYLDAAPNSCSDAG